MACKVSDDERKSVEAQVGACQAQLNQTESLFAGERNVSEMRYQYLNNSCSATIDDVRGQATFSYAMLFLGLAVIAVVGLYMYRKHTIKNYLEGRVKRQDKHHEVR